MTFRYQERNTFINSVVLKELPLLVIQQEIHGTYPMHKSVAHEHINLWFGGLVADYCSLLFCSYDISEKM